MIHDFATFLVLVALVAAPPATASAQSASRELVRPEPASVRAAAIDERVLVLHDVRDLVGGSEAELAAEPAGIPTLGEAFERAEKSQAASELDRASERQRARDRTLELGRFVLARLSPAPSTSDYQLEVTTPGSIALVARPDLQKRFETFVAEQRASTKVVDLAVRYVEGELADLERLGVTRDSGPRVLAQSAEEIDRLVRSNGRLSMLGAPRLLARPLQQARVSVLDETKYVQDWAVEKVLPGPKEIAVPVIGTLRIGQEVSLRAAVRADGIALQLAVDRSTLAALRTHELRLKGAGDPLVEIALPEVAHTRVSADALVADGGTLAFLAQRPKGDSPAAQARELLVIVTAKLVDAR